ncbi:helix-turn-helix domain-containing protein [Parabacteroides sp. FAFU027]|uniref:helix-turn-helix domain-containing protein n=1 Tax=Parabacteroides sp. FAFU027 TaxID=2922715 RepID=UPI001FAFB793|nr:helix-turn-helix transcriptional regulator [Parabacteroides sp. FAFU027]
MDTQKRIFKIIKEKLPPHMKLADVIAELLDIGTDSVYRRTRGEKELTLSELKKICTHFQISMDEILNHKSNGITFRYSTLDFVNDPRHYHRYIDQFAKNIELSAKAEDKEILFTAEDIPVFHFMPYPELIFFKLYVWHQTICNQPCTYDQFVADLGEKEELYTCYKRIMNSYRRIPSSEVWTHNTIDPILRLLDYYYDMECFEDKQIPLLLCKQLSGMIDTIAEWTDLKKKGEDNDTDFHLYLSPVNPENSFFLNKRNGMTLITVKLFTINSLATTDKAFCTETETWIRNTISKSMFLSGASERERFRFFQQLRGRINALTEKFES